MARGIDRIWVRFGLGIAATVLVTIGILSASVFALAEYQYRSFYRSLPASVQEELDELNEQDLEDSPRAAQIYGQYWQGDLLFGEKWSLVIGLVICLPFGLAVGFWVSRIVTLPMASVAEAARRIALGDLSVRAQVGQDRGEMADMVRDFNHMTDALESLERERKATAASLSHELRTPLTVLRARLHAICDGVIPADPRECRKLLDQVEHLGRLVEDLHTMSVAEAGRLSLQKVETDLVQLVSDTLAAHATHIAEHGIQAELQASVSSLWVQVDPDRMRQVLTNLVENALRHAADGGWMGVGVGTEGGHAIVTVSDDGPGLPENVRRNLFQRFQRAPRSPGTVGSGLGLSIVHMLVTLQGGTVQAGESERGGTRFIVRLPCN
ncbi:sensor histidine kinase [Xylophilus sp. ASV27]|uniref:sensor histidine kinase n=1 Tax=Xylophilus sp. ASV27 TaxID=2795129 RepID=UPI0018EA8D29|nr:ATP-binding protein [Xylophilus sp. ASV27]